MSGFTSPNHTQVPNDLFDNFMCQMSESELKVVLFAIRQTLGFHKSSDTISLSRFVKGTGLSRQGVVDGIGKAKGRGLLREVARGKRGAVVYELVISEDQTSQQSGLVNKIDQSNELTRTSQQNRPQPDATSQQNRHTKERVLKEKGNKDIALPNSADKPKPKRTPRKRDEDAIPAEQMNPMKDAIHAAFNYPAWELMTGSEKGQVQKIARELCKAGYQPVNVATIYAYCKAKFDNFGPGALSKHASVAIKMRETISALSHLKLVKADESVYAS